MSKSKLIKLNNGATIIYNRNRANNYSAVTMGFLCGHKDNFKNGLAHFVEHMLMKETTSISFDKMKEIKTEVCPRINACTGDDNICVEFERTNKLFEESFKLASDILLNPTFNEDIMKTERGVINEEYKLKLNKLNHLPELFESQSITNDTTPEIALGTIEDLNNTTKEDLISFKEKYFTSNNFILSYCGNLHLAKVKRLANKYIIKHLKEDKSISFQPKCYKIIKGPNLFICTNDDENLKIVISYKNDKLNIYERNMVKYDAMLNYLSKDKNLFHNELRSKGLVYFSNIRCQRFSDGSLVNLIIYTSKEKLYECLKIVNNSIRYVLNKKLPEKFISTYKNNIKYKEDECRPKVKIEIAYSNLNRYCRYKDIDVITKREYKKYVKDLTENDVQEAINEFFGNNAKPYITIMGNINESEVASYDELCSILMNGTSRHSINKNN